MVVHAEQVFRQQKPFVALSKEPLNCRDRYQMILHPELLMQDRTLCGDFVRRQREDWR